MEPSFGYTFPAIRGIQAGREYYVSMCPLRLIPKVFLFDEDELVPELRAQRTLNKSRIPEIARYILSNRQGYVFSALTASIDGDVKFEPLVANGDGRRVGVMTVSMEAKFIINDGQHRRAAIEAALRDCPDIGDETIAVVFFLDVGLERCQQMFADLNRYAIRPSPSIGVLYDHRDNLAHLARLAVIRSPVFRDIVEMERSTLSPRSRKLFTLSAIYQATSALLDGMESKEIDATSRVVLEYWEEVAKHFPEWEQVRERKMPAGEVRRDFIHSHGIVLHALGRVGNALWQNSKANWKARLSPLRRIDWSRTNTKLWEGRALIGGQVCKAGHNLTLTTNLVKHRLKLELTPEEQRVEDAFRRSKTRGR